MKDGKTETEKEGIEAIALLIKSVWSAGYNQGIEDGSVGCVETYFKGRRRSKKI